MSSIISPTNYGLLSYGIVSYVAYFSTQVPITVVTQPFVVETVTNQFLPSFVKVYYSVQE